MPQACAILRHCFDGKEFGSDRKTMSSASPSARAVNWDDLRLFLAVARAGSVAQAAPTLALSQPTVSRALAGLERRVGRNLLVRSRSGFTLTPEGQALFAHAERIEAEVRHALEADRGPIRITAGGWISRFLATHAARLAGEDLSIEIFNSYATVDLTTAQADIALRLRRPERGYVLIRSLPVPSFAVYVRADAEEGLYHGDWGTAAWVTFDTGQIGLPSARWLAREVPHLKPRLRCSQGINILDAVCGGVGIGVLPRFIGDADPHLKRLSPTLPLENNELWLVVHEDRRASPPIATAIDRLVTLFADERAQLQPSDT
ncbi:LysR family transcriptional regulator [Elstera sp.]|uniref:LysR family transcriptional regulator n=1 Tax=Elstera sp. TaxID=1916664 RepID=UPI0037BF322A